MFGQKQSLTQIDATAKHKRSNTQPFVSQNMTKINRPGLTSNLHHTKVKEQIRNKLNLTDKIEEVSQNELNLPPKLNRIRNMQQNKAKSKVLNKSKEQIQLEKTIKLKQLYNKKAELLQKLKILNRQARIKTTPNTEEQKVIPISTVNVKKDSPKIVVDSNSRYRPLLKNQRVSSLCKEKFNSQITPFLPDNSVENDKKILDFIRKMHEQRIKREAHRMQQFHKMMKSQMESQIELKSSKINRSTHFSSYVG